MIKPDTGILLIADPFLKDPSFLRTVVLICDHDEKGSIGLVINKKMEETIDELVAAFNGIKMPVYYGGPVREDTLHFVHQYPDLIPNTNKIGEGIYWGGNFETVIALLKNNTIKPNRIKFFIGYSGWEEGQLKEEVDEKSWLTVSATKQLVFNTAPDEIWKGSLKHLGGSYEMLKNFPIDPTLN